MSNVVGFTPRVKDPDKDHHLAGEAVCLTCRHKWAAVAPVGTTCLECPSCGTERGSWMYPVLAKPDQVRFTCNCGSELFSIMPDHLMCAGCGAEAKGF